MSKPRPMFTTRSGTGSKQYDSNTLPSEMPKKRRAPLPPMPNSQSAPQELAEVKTESDTVKSNSLDRNEQVSCICFTSPKSISLELITSIVLLYICWCLKLMGNKAVVLAFENFSLKITTEIGRRVSSSLRVMYAK